MENNQDLFKQAILDAKAVRETAMAAARTTLAEHFEPFIKRSMQETLSEDSMSDDTMPVENMNEDPNLDDILAELDELSKEMEESIEEGHMKADGYDGKAGKGSTGYNEKAKTSRGDHKLHEADDDEAGDDSDTEAEPEAEPVADDMPADGEAPKGPAQGKKEVIDLDVDELTDIMRDVLQQFMAGQEGGEGMNQGTFDADTEMAADMGLPADEDGDDESKETTLEEILAELEMEEKKMEEAAFVPGKKLPHNAEDVRQIEEMGKELREAIKTIKTLRTELNEVNLFSAKMLYVNKLFKAKNLNESQKTKVVNAFDRATSIKEVENTYKTLLESVDVAKKSTLRESVGFASKAIGSAPARPIVEVDAFVTRWQQLAGISK